MTRRRTALLHSMLVCAAAVCSGYALAADAPPPNALACQACHGRDGISTHPEIPNLAGQRAEYLARQLQAFKDGSRPHELMAVIAAQLDARDIQQLAAHWSRQPAGGDAGGAGGALHAAIRSAMALPKDFPQAYTEYGREEDAQAKTLSVKYANAIAVASARAGAPLLDGSVILVVGHAAELDAAGQPVLDARGRMKVGKALSFSGMEARVGWGADIPALLRNGNWLYGLWRADGTPRLGEGQPACLVCHKARAADSFVFTLGELQRAVR
jgi:cytochrome c553